ncbi:hypothetical protein LWE69_17735 [Paenibacillus sp. UKAQ_18]|nr:hypothetical protein [Paenibacillus sp. UKAQ_18]
MEEITLLVVFAAGVLSFSFLSPYVFPLRSAYVSHISDTMIAGVALS